METAVLASSPHDLHSFCTSSRYALLRDQRIIGTKTTRRWPLRRYLLVLDMDLLGMDPLALDEELGQEPINYLVVQQEQQPCEVVVLSLVATRRAKLSALELALGAAIGKPSAAPGRYLVAPQPGHDINAAAEHRMRRAVRHLKTIGCQASGLISDQELVKAVAAETPPSQL